MKTLKTLLAFGLLLISTVSTSANDYALLDTYPLLNDMKILQKEQLILNNIHSLITNHKNSNKAKLDRQKRMFTTIIVGLSKGDNTIGIQGTELVFLKNKINTIQLLWSQEKEILDAALNNKMYRNDAYVTINNLSSHITTLNKLYKQSYARYQQNSIMKSLVSSYMKRAFKAEPMYAMNVIR